MERTELIFNEIFLVDSRLNQLGIEAECVLEETKQMYVDCGEEKSKELIKLENIAMKAKMGVLCGKDKIQGTSSTRCRYWNRGYCKEGATKCPYYHPPSDCQQHLQEGRCSSQGCGLRHRKRCKYWGTPAGCFRNDHCQYLHVVDKVTDNQVEVSSDMIVKYRKNSYEHKEMDTYIIIEDDIGVVDSAESNGNVEKEASDLIENTQKKFQCHICKYKCKNNNMMKKHFNSKHKEHLTCTLCDSKFSYAAAAAKC